MPDKIRILFLGDIIGRPGRRVIGRYLSPIIRQYYPTLIVANAENAAGGIGLTEPIGRELFSWMDVLTSGNHIWDKKEAVDYLGKEPRLLRPANYPDGNPGRGTYVWQAKDGQKVGILNLQGRVFMEPLDCPFRIADERIAELREETSVILVDFHAEATSEKQALGWHLDGKVSAVFGTHTHVPTADDRILPQGTAYITDVGMVGAYDSVIGIRRDQAIERFLTSRPQRFEPSKAGAVLGGILVEIDAKTGKALSLERITHTEEERARTREL